MGSDICRQKPNPPFKYKAEQVGAETKHNIWWKGCNEYGSDKASS